jgi:sortase A
LEYGAFLSVPDDTERAAPGVAEAAAQFKRHALMKSAPVWYTNPWRWLEYTLWIVGLCALAYCIFVVLDAAIIQACLARMLERSRDTATHSAVLSQTAAAVTTKPAKKGISLRRADLLGRLEIPRIGLSAVVLEGVGPRTMRVALGHIPGTSSPGQPGNVGIAGHRDTLFRALRLINMQDEIVLETTAKLYHYRVTSLEVVDPDYVVVLRSNNKDQLTLVTCYPFSYLGPAPKRFIVHANLAP